MEIANNNYLFTYTLLQEQGKRISRRATIWRYVNGQRKVVYHQGTLCSPVLSNGSE